jgi:Transketolase, thiamine diphosphate binding domain
MLAVDAVQKAKSEHPGTPMDAAPAARRCGSACRDMTRRTPVGSIATASCCPGCTPPSQERCAPERETYDAPELETYELIQFVPASLRYGSIIWPDIDPSNLPENVCSRLLSLLQCLPSQTFSVDFRAAKKARFRAVLRVGLGVRQPERYGKCLSERRSLSEAWGLADLLYKLLCQLYQPINLIEGPSRDLGDHAALAKARSALAIRSNR